MVMWLFFRDCILTSLDVQPYESAIVIKYTTKVSLVDGSNMKAVALLNEKTGCTKL